MLIKIRFIFKLVSYICRRTRLCGWRTISRWGVVLVKLTQKRAWNVWIRAHRDSSYSS